MANDSKNVSATRGVQGGYIFSAPYSAAIPTDPDTALGSDFVCLGFIGEDGVSESIETDSTEFRDMNGDLVAVSTSTRTETASFTLIELNTAALKEIYGQSNVIEDTSKKYIKVLHKDAGAVERRYVLELLLKDNRKWRQIIPAGVVTEVGDLTLASGDLSGREITITCEMDTAAGASVIDYIKTA